MKATKTVTRNIDKPTAKEWMAQMDAQIMKLAMEVNPLMARMLKATYQETPEEALATLQAVKPVTLKCEVYFICDEYMGNGIVYRIDSGGVLKVFSPETQKMYTVDVSMVEVL